MAGATKEVRFDDADKSAALATRLDFGTLGKAERTPSGGVRVPAAMTRSGILVYRRADGTTVRELRPESEVFHADSLASLADAPVTRLHPPALVTPDTYKRVAIGHVRDGARRDGKLVAGTVVVQDADGIAEIEGDKLREVSCGYTCRIDATPGTHEGQPYDQVQRTIRYNHVALGPRGWGRAGADVALRVDHDDAVERVDDDDHTTPKAPERKTMETERIDGIDYKVGSPEWKQAHTKRLADLETKAKRSDELQGRVDGLTQELATTKKRLDEAHAPATLDALVAKRGALLEKAKRVLGESVKLDGLTERQVLEACAKKANPELRVDGLSDDYLRGRFEATSETRNDAFDDAARRVINPPAVTDDPYVKARYDAALRLQGIDPDKKG